MRWFFTKNLISKTMLVTFSISCLAIILLITVNNLKFNESSYFKSTLVSIEKACSLTNKKPAINSNGDFYTSYLYDNECITNRISNSLEKVNPALAAQIVFETYKKPNFPIITGNCHSIVHSLGRHLAQISGKTNLEDDKFKLCSSGFLHGYYEKAMEDLSATDFAHKGFSMCATAVKYKGGVQDCAHTYGHLLYLKNSSDLLESSKFANQCLLLPSHASETCLNGFFMQLLGDPTYRKAVMAKQETADINHILDNCLKYDEKSIVKSCVVMSWDLVNTFFSAYPIGSSSPFESAALACSTIRPDLLQPCGMMLGFMSVNLANGSATAVVQDCETLKEKNAELFDGCILWGARTLWRQTYVDADFDFICKKISFSKSQECLKMRSSLAETGLPASM